jgi:arylsulfatase
LGYGDLGCYGQRKIKTPHIDRLAAEGMRFTQFYSGAPVCAPSRCVLFTGKHTGHAFIRDNRATEPEGQWPIPGSEVTLAELLKKQGYATGAMGKWGLGMVGTSGDPNKQGFDLFYGYNCQAHAHNHYPAYLWRNDRRETIEGNDGKSLSGAQFSQDLFTREALQFIRDHQERPFFLYLPFTIPHLSIQVPDESLREYQGKLPEEDYKHTSYLQHPAPRAGYAAMVSHMDRAVGQVLDVVKELGLEEQTIVLFTSDNGPLFERFGGTDSAFFNSAGPFRGAKGSVYEAGIRVPLIVRWPGKIQPGGESGHVAAFCDVLPTLMDLTNGETPSGLDGLSLGPTLLGQGEQAVHEFLYWEFPSYGGQQAVRLGDWKGVRKKLLGKMPQLSIELYNLADDIGEEHNVAADQPDVVERIAKIMRQQHVPSPDFPFPALDGE